jgi:hypothetical protein
MTAPINHFAANPLIRRSPTSNGRTLGDEPALQVGHDKPLKVLDNRGLVEMAILISHENRHDERAAELSLHGKVGFTESNLFSISASMRGRICRTFAFHTFNRAVNIGAKMRVQGAAECRDGKAAGLCHPPVPLVPRRNSLEAQRPAV